MQYLVWVGDSRRIIEAPNEADAAAIAVERYGIFPDRIDVAEWDKRNE